MARKARSRKTSKASKKKATKKVAKKKRPARRARKKVAATSATGLATTTSVLGACSFQRQNGDEDVTGESDGDLGFRIRMIAEQGNGAWVFQTPGRSGARLLREVSRPS